jgi:basic membrane protein A
VRSVNPNATVKVVWTNTWYDPAAEKEAAKGLLDAGVDVIAQHQDTPGPQQAAEEKGVYAIGYNTDMSSFAPKANLTSPIWNWGPYYVKVVEAVKNGTWTNEQYWGGMADNVVDLAPINSVVPEDVKKLVEEKKQAIINGEFDVFWGPIKDQSGQVKVAEGQKMTDAEMLSFDWFVEGVDGTIPK